MPSRSTTSEYQPSPPFNRLRVKGSGSSESAMPANGVTMANTANTVRPNACCAPTSATTGNMPKITPRFSA